MLIEDPHGLFIFLKDLLKISHDVDVDDPSVGSGGEVRNTGNEEGYNQNFIGLCYH